MNYTAEQVEALIKLDGIGIPLYGLLVIIIIMFLTLILAYTLPEWLKKRRKQSVYKP